MVPEPVVSAVTSLLTREMGRTPELHPPRPVGGGCINPSARLETDRGETFFLKWNDSADPSMFEAEADGLRGLAAPGALRIPRVWGWGGSCTPGDPGWLLLEFVATGSPGGDYGRHLGEGLATLHAAGSTWQGSGPTDMAGGEDGKASEGPFGWRRDNFIGSLPQQNRPMQSWASFWRECRIGPQVKLARDRGYFGSRDGELLDAVLDRMEDLLPESPEAGPALLHGDLWSGNYYPDELARPVLIDPATYLGDGEVDLAMMELFGSFPRGFRESYQEARGISHRYLSYGRDLYQLYYLLVHVNLFGSGYVGSTLGAVGRVLAET